MQTERKLTMGYLNDNNIERSKNGIEYHPLIPFLPPNAKVFFLGSFPPQQKRWCINFYYPNFINDHWRIEGEVFFNDKNHFVDIDSKCFKLNEIIEHCQHRGIAFFDTSYAVRRLKDNASDKFLEVEEQTDVRLLLSKLPMCRSIVTTGEKATATLCEYFSIETPPKVNSYCLIPNTYNKEGKQIILYRLPSSSRAYPLAFNKKVEAYRRMFEFVLQ